MKVLVATTVTQGKAAGDYCSTVEGELVYLQPMTCADPACGCGRGFAGISSRRATTTAMVVERPDLTPDDLSLALITSLHEGGWLDPGWSADNERFLDELLTLIEVAVDGFGDGTVLGRAGDYIYERPGVSSPGLRAA